MLSVAYKNKAGDLHVSLSYDVLVVMPCSVCQKAWHAWHVSGAHTTPVAMPGRSCGPLLNGLPLSTKTLIETTIILVTSPDAIPMTIMLE